MMKAPNLRTLRQRRLLSQQDLASKAGVAPRTVVSLEAGGAARYVTLRKLAEALGVSAETLLAEPPADQAKASA